MAPQPTEVIVTKRRVGAFATTDLESIIRAHQVTTLALLGIATSGVVLSTVRWAADADYELLVLEDCCADADEEVHRVLMHKVFPRQATVVQAQEFLQALAPRGRKTLEQMLVNCRCCCSPVTYNLIGCWSRSGSAGELLV